MGRAKRVTESEWVAGKCPRMVVHARRIGTDRQRRLLLCGFCRAAAEHIPDARWREAVEAAELYADELLTHRKCRFERFGSPYQWNWDGTPEDIRHDLVHCLDTMQEVSYSFACDILPVFRSRKLQMAILLELFDNPFRPATFDTSWRTSTVIAVSQEMYETRSFFAMPILADALQDAGCEDDRILSHCRNPEQVHVRGCWVVDLVLGKS